MYNDLEDFYKPKKKKKKGKEGSMCDAAYEVNHELLNDFFGLYKELWGDKRNNIDFKYNPTNLYLHLYEYSK